jgi:hypothetical protein
MKPYMFTEIVYITIKSKTISAQIFLLALYTFLKQQSGCKKKKKTAIFR